MTEFVRTLMFFSSSTSASVESSTLNPKIILFSSGSVFVRYTSFFEIGPMPALMIGICFCFSKISSASREPNESAFATIPISSVWISSEISFWSSFRSVLSVVVWNGIPGRISSFEVICSLIPDAASTLFTVWYPLFRGFASWMFRIFVVTGLSKLAIVISSEVVSLPS